MVVLPSGGLNLGKPRLLPCLLAAESNNSPLFLTQVHHQWTLSWIPHVKYLGGAASVALGRASQEGVARGTTMRRT
jgi:hypothetical protein